MIAESRWHVALVDVSAGIPLGRVGRPGEISATVVFPVSDGGGYVNAAMIQID